MSSINLADFDWKAASERLAKLLPPEVLEPYYAGTLKSLRRWQELQEQALVQAVACSGGADSVCLLLLIYAQLPSRNTRIIVLHFDHCLRGEASAADAAFVRSIAEALGLEFVLGHWEREPEEKVNEANARRARLDFFEKQMRHRGISTLYQGHHLNDIAESMLMHIARGGNLSAIAGPMAESHFRRGLFAKRPLLTLGKQDIVSALQRAGVPWREDASNAEGIFLRNRIRNQVIPAWDEACEHELLQGVLRVRERLLENERALNAWCDQYLGHFKDKCFPRAELERQGAPKAIWRRALEHWLRLHEIEHALSSANKDALLSALLENDLLSLSVDAETRIRCMEGELSLIKEAVDSPLWSACKLPVSQLVRIDGVGEISATLVTLGQQGAPDLSWILEGNADDRREVFLSPPFAAQAGSAPELFVRPWQAGDRYQPLGAPGSRKLQDCFTDRKIPLAERSRLPLVCSTGGDILWVPGLPPAETSKLQAGTEVALQLTYLPAKAII